MTIYDEKALSPGYLFVSPYEDANKLERGQPWVGPYVYDGYGDLIWVKSKTFGQKGDMNHVVATGSASNTSCSIPVISETPANTLTHRF